MTKVRKWRAWANVDKAGSIPTTYFSMGRLAVYASKAMSATYKNVTTTRTVRVEIREVRASRRGGGK